MANRAKITNSILGKRIRELREENGESQKELGLFLNKAESTVRMWELGNSEPDMETLKMIADHYNTSTDYLLGKTSFRNFNLQLFASETPTYTEHEQNIIQAYRSQPEIQPAVDRLLGIEKSNKNTVYTVYNAAIHPDNHEGIVEMDAERWDQMEDTDKTDDELL